MCMNISNCLRKIKSGAFSQLTIYVRLKCSLLINVSHSGAWSVLNVSQFKQYSQFVLSIIITACYHRLRIIKLSIFVVAQSHSGFFKCVDIAYTVQRLTFHCIVILIGKIGLLFFSTSGASYFFSLYCLLSLVTVMLDYKSRLNAINFSGQCKRASAIARNFRLQAASHYPMRGVLNVTYYKQLVLRRKACRMAIVMLLASPMVSFTAMNKAQIFFSSGSKLCQSSLLVCRIFILLSNWGINDFWGSWFV